MAEYLKELRHLEMGVRWASHCRHYLDRAKASGNAHGVFYLDMLALCCKLGKGNLVIENYQREALGKFLDTVAVLPFSEYRTAVRGLRSEMEPELQQAFREAKPLLVQAGDREALDALEKIASLRWEASVDTDLIARLSRGLTRLRDRSRSRY